MYEQSTNRDELRARFTKWMQVVLLRERRKYLQKRKADEAWISLDDLSEDAFPTTKELHTGGFEFETAWLADAFSQLSPERQEILTLLFAQEWKASEIAKKLTCSPQHVYDQKYQAIRLLRRREQRKGGEGK